MQVETIQLKQRNSSNKIQLSDSQSVCNSLEEQIKLNKLFEIFIQVDKRLQKQSNETRNTKRNTNSPCKAQ